MKNKQKPTVISHIQAFIMAAAINVLWAALLSWNILAQGCSVCRIWSAFAGKSLKFKLILLPYGSNVIQPMKK